MPRDAWTQATSAAAWGARSDHTSVVFDGRMWVLGGYDGTYRNDVWWWAPYRASGIYISSDHDTGINDTRITQVPWTATGPSLTLEVAASNSPNPTNWEPVTNPDTAVSVTGRYIRYRATFAGTGLSDDPELEEVTIGYAFPTSLTCSVDNSAPAPGQEINFSGSLTDRDGTGVSGKVVYLYRGGSSTGLTAVTDANGRYSILAEAPSTPRTHEYTVRFGGDASYLSSESPAVQVTVMAPNQPPYSRTAPSAQRLDWLGENFVFKVTYTDADGDVPAYV